MILGSGSASFEMLRYLVERLPVMTPPRWVNTPCQPIAIADVLNYLVGCLENDAAALDKTLTHQVDTCWYDAGELIPPAWAACGDADWAGGTLMTCGYRVRIKSDPETVWNVVRTVGADRGWYYAKPLWWLRGLLDRLAGGVGLRRSLRHPKDLWVGDVVDFWRVLEIDDMHKLVLLAEMKVR